MAILIKRYANRKLYNTQTSRYITLKGIATLLNQGEEVRVIDKETGEDITQVALSQILVDKQRAREDPSDTLISQILSLGGDALYGAIKKSVDDATDGLGDFQGRFRQFVSPDDETPPAREAEAPDSDSARAGSEPPRSDESNDPRGRSRRGNFPDFREAIQAAVGHALDLEALGDFPRRQDLEALGRNLDRVAEAMERLEETLRERDPADG